MAGRNGPLFEPDQSMLQNIVQFDDTPNMEGMGLQAPYHTSYSVEDGHCDDNGYGGATIPPWSPDNTSHTNSHTNSQPPLNNGSAFMQRPLATHETPTLGSRGQKGRPTSTGLYMRLNEQTVPFQRLRPAPHPKLNQLQNSSRMKGRLTAAKGIGGVDKTPTSSEYGSMYTKTYGAAPRSSAGNYKNKAYWYEDNLQKVTSKPLRHASKAPL
ncbi:Hypp1169 [Branchiostoma lanceolatum]|nr:Hypp1169 [Branchiostoma lanceolatum]